MTAAARPARSRRQLSRRGRVLIGVAVVALLTLVLSLRGLARFYTDYLWFDSVGQSDVWRGTVGARLSLGLIFTGLFFLVMWLNLMLADRLAPPVRPAGPEEDLLAGYHAIVGPRVGLLRIVLSVLFALVAGAGVSSRWKEWLLFRHGRDFGVKDPQFGWDIGWYVFKLPFLSFVVDWAFAAIVIVLALTAVAHYLNGGIRFQTAGRRSTPVVKAHLSVLLGLLALLKAVSYWFAGFELTTSHRGVADGALYTDVRAQLPATRLLILISLFAAALLLYNIWRKGWTLPILAVGLWAFVAVVVGAIYPAVVQQFRVKPDESAKEAEYIGRNIEATRAAYGLVVEESTFDVSVDAELTAAEVRADAETIANVRLLDPAELGTTFALLEGERGYYRFTDIDTDRYLVDGELRQLLIAVREIDPDETGSWVKAHVQFTHGYGAAASYGSQVDSNGEPVFVIGGLPLETDQGAAVDLERPQVYFGDELGGYVVVGAKDPEVDYATADDQTVEFSYDGEGGVAMGSFLRRTAFALRFGAIEPLISGQITGDSRVLYIRDVAERVRTVAPFLSWDADPYPVLHDGRIVFVIDGYTTTDRYPYSESAPTSTLPSGSGLRRGFNYVRHSVKAVVDAYDGSVDLYTMPGDDPILDAWRDAFPDLFQDFSSLPTDIIDHSRFPTDLFTVQTELWGRYHLDDPGEWFAQTNSWLVAQDPGTGSGSRQTQTQNAEGVSVSTTARIAPYHGLLRLPGSDELLYGIVRSYVPQSDDRQKFLTAMIVGDLAPDGTLRLQQLFARGRIAGPAQVDGVIRANEEISRFQTEIGQQGSAVIFGEMSMVPLADEILYIRPVFVRANNDGADAGGVTQLRKVVAVVGSQIAFEDSLREAIESLTDADLGDVFGAGVIVPPTDTSENPPPEAPAEDEDLATLLTRIAELKNDRDAAIANGNLEEFGRLQTEIDMLLDDAIALIPGATSTTTTTTTTLATET